MKSMISLLTFFLVLGNMSAKSNLNKENLPNLSQNNACLTNPCVTVVCPPDLTIDCIENFIPDAQDASAMSVCGTILAQWVTEPDQTGGPNCPATTYVFTYKAVDDLGNIGCCERTVTIDNAAPVITVPPGLTIDCYDDCLIFPEDATVTTSCGEDLEVTIYSPVVNGILDCPGTTYTWTYRVEDQCEREATADRVFVNGPNDPPVIEAPDDTTCDCFAGITPNAANATVITSCTLGAIKEVSYLGNNGPMDCPGTTYTYEYKATDDCGRMVTDLQVFTIDNGPPVFDNCPENCLTLNCDDDYETFIEAWLSTITAHTSCGLPLTVTNDYDPDSQGVCFDDGTVTVHFFATDQCGRTSVCQGMILVLDTEAPQFGPLPGQSEVECNGQIEFVDIEATDNCTEVTLTYEDEMVLDPCLGGEATRTWTAMDECGNSATIMQMITVLPDTDAPVFTFVPDDYAIDCNGMVVFGDATAVDVCSNLNLSFMDATVGDICNGGTATRTWTAEDDCGNSSMASQTITLLPDTEGPHFTFVPADLTINCDETPVFGDDATATDNCGSVMLSFVDDMNGDLCNGGTATRTWTAEDDCGNTTLALQTISILPDTEAPEFTFVPADLTINCDDPVVFGDNAMASDDCGNVSLSFIDGMSGDLCNGGTATRTWTAEDDCGNSVAAMQKITILPDTEAPEFTFVPADLTINCDDPVVFGDATASDDCGNVEITFMDSTTGDVCNGGMVTRTWTAEDDCGNSVTASQTITILPDTEVPEFTFVPADLTINCEDPVVFGDATASDDCGNVGIAFIDSTTGDVCNGGTATRTWTAEDDCGNSATAMQTITILPDTETPEFTFVPADLTINCDDPVLFGDDAMAADDCGLVTLTFVDALSGDLCTGQTATRTWTAEDDCGNSVTAVQTITILPDTETPEFTFVPADLTVDCDDPVLFGDDAMATDDCGMVTLTFVDALSGDLCTGQTATRTWTAEDDCGNSVTAMQTITILPDTEAPEFTVVPADLTINCDDPVIFGVPMAEDNCGTAVLGFVYSVTGDICNGQIAMRTWTAEDDCGNISIAVQTITILPDTEAPAFTFVPADLTINCDDPIVFGDAAAEDDCGAVMLTFADNTTGTLCSGRTATRTWTAEDDCGNTTMAVQTITILPDTEAPEFTFVPADLTINCDEQIVFGDATASDDCGVVTFTFMDATTGDLCNGRMATRTWTAMDQCNNSSMVTQTITVLPDMEAPIFTFVPADLTIDCNEIPVFGDDVMTTDDCGNVMLSFIDNTTGDLCTGRTATRTWTAVDDCNNSSQATQTITVLPDSQAPVFTFVPADYSADCNDPVAFGDPLIEDDCGNVDLTFMDAIVGDFCLGGMATRTWTATDDCGNSTMATQTVTFDPDTEDPVLTCPDTITLHIQSVGVCERPWSIVPNANDNCSNDLDIAFSIDFGEDGIIDSTGVIPFINLFVSYPIGTNIVTFTTEDECGNTDTCVTVVIVRDLVPPAFICTPVTVTLSLVDSMGNATPGEFIFPPFFECCEDTVLFELPGGIFTDSLFFDCDDTQFVNGIDVTIRAFDCFGNSAACNTKVFVVPPFEAPDLCNPEPPPFAFINGQVATENGEFMENVPIDLSGGMADETLTSEVGYYEFLTLQTDYDYSISPHLNIDPLNGLSTLDILLINQHILSMQTLDSPYKMIAADVNQSGSITLMDVLEMQQLILGSIPEFNNNTSWRFIDANFLFPNNENPFISVFPEICTINNLNSGVSHVDFVGLKTGDVNGTATVNLQSGDSEDRGDGELVFRTPEQQIAENETIIVPFRAKDFQRILGFQFSFEFDPVALELLSIKPGKLSEIEEKNFGYHFLEEGVLTATWHSVSPYSVVDGDVLFELEFLAKEDAILSRLVALSSFFTEAEAYQQNEPVLALKLQFTGEEAKAADPLEFQNRPNPFKDETIISFHLSREIRGVFTLLDVNRQVILQKRDLFPEGYNELVIHGKDLPAYGIYYYQFKTAKHNIWRKMIFIDDL